MSVSCCCSKTRHNLWWIVKRDAVIGIEMNVLYPCYNFEIVTYINFGFKLKALMAFYDFTYAFIPKMLSFSFCFSFNRCRCKSNKSQSLRGRVNV